MGRKELNDPETSDWPVRGAHVVAPVGVGSLNSPMSHTDTPVFLNSARMMVLALYTPENL